MFCCQLSVWHALYTHVLQKIDVMTLVHHAVERRALQHVTAV